MISLVFHTQGKRVVKEMKIFGKESRQSQERDVRFSLHNILHKLFSSFMGCSTKAVKTQASNAVLTPKTERSLVSTRKEERK
jgi:hypothetical protein